MNFTINNLSIHVHAATDNAAPAQPTILAAFLRALHEPSETEEGADLAPQEPDTEERYASPTAPTAHPLAHDVPACVDAVEAFLAPTERFQCRTMKAINKAMTAKGFNLMTVATALHTMVEDDVVTTRRRRADGETLYSLA